MNNKRKLELFGELIIFSDEVKELSNIFFEKITIYNSNNFQYLIKTRLGQLNKWNKDKQIFSNIDIEIELNVEKDDFIALISHELNQAFKDYKLRLSYALFENKNIFPVKISNLDDIKLISKSAHECMAPNLFKASVEK